MRPDTKPSPATRKPLQPVDSRANLVDSGGLSKMMEKKLHITEKEHHDMENETIDWEKERKDMDKLFEQQAEEKLQNLPPFDKPKAFKKTLKLFDHQKDGIRWLVQQEQFPAPNVFCRERHLKDGTVVSS